MIEKDAEKLLQKYLNGKCTPEEKAWVESWYLDVTEKSGLHEQFIDYKSKEAEIWSKLEHGSILKSNTRSLWPRIAAAAAILVAFIAIGNYFLGHQKAKQQIYADQKNDLAPGGNNAVLTLANGSKVVLNHRKNGEISIQGSTAVTKKTDGQLVYQLNNTRQDRQAVLYNTITTPKGGRYWVILADGTKVLLNAASSLKYPTAFVGNERLVELTGEAYFEVVHDNKSPFRVKTGSQLVQDVGTHFNIQAYNDEPAITTTLLEGSVEVSLISGGQHKTITLRPNQQSRLSHGDINLVPHVDVNLAVGWKDGHFRFKDAGIEEVMRELARWYDIDIIYEGTLPHDLFTGSIHRNINASQALEILSFFKVHYRIEGKKIIIIP